MDVERTGDDDQSGPQPPPQTEQTVLLTDVDVAKFLGPKEQLIADLETQHPRVNFFVRGHVLTLRGPVQAVKTARRVVEQVHAHAKEYGAVSSHDVREVTDHISNAPDSQLTASRVLSEPILTVRGNQIRPQTRGQRSYVDAIDSHTVVFGIGPAGTGKTYLAMAKAVQALQRRDVAKIILTRPAVEAGERLGYLPGTLEEKIDPYLRPLFDAIGSMLDAEAIPQLLANGTIEVAPLAYMRGRTLNEAFVILDEAQNTTPEQMKMFLTRLGYGSKMVVTGDATQVDLPIASSGLRRAKKILLDVEDIHFSDLTSDDIVRHSLVGRIVDAYSAYEEESQRRNDRSSHER